MPENLKELEVVTDKLNALLKDPQPGLISWCMFLDERLRELSQLLDGMGYVKYGGNTNG